MMVRVTNTSTEDFVEAWAGGELVIPAGKKVEIPVEAAEIYFGYGLKDKEPALVRLGWIRLHSELPAGIKKLAMFKIEDDGTRPSLSPVPERVPLNSPKGSGGKLTLAAAPQNA